MKYIGIRDRQGSGRLELLLGCSKCGECVEEGWYVCPGCGKALRPLPESLEGEKVCDVLTAIMGEARKRKVYRRFWGIPDSFVDGDECEDCGSGRGGKE